MKKYILLSLFLLLVGSSTAWAAASNKETIGAKKARIIKEIKGIKERFKKGEIAAKAARGEIEARIIKEIKEIKERFKKGEIAAKAARGEIEAMKVMEIMEIMGLMEIMEIMEIIKKMREIGGRQAIVAVKAGMRAVRAARLREEIAKKIYKGLASFLGIGGLVTFTYLYQKGDQSEVYAQKNEGSDARPSKEKKNSSSASKKVIKHSPDVGQDKKVAPSISSSIGIYPLLFTLIVLGGLYLFLYRDFYFSALPQPAAADDAYGTGRDVLSGEEGEATPSGTEAGKYPILLGVLVLIGSVALYIYTNYSGEEDDQVEESA